MLIEIMLLIPIEGKFPDINSIMLQFLTGTCITKTRPKNIDPLEPHFYIVKLDFTGVYIIFLISAQNIDCEYPLEPPRRGDSDKYPQSMF